MSESSTLLPADQSARERFIDETGTNFCVCAGAGAGKTTAITRRIASLAAKRGSDPRLLSKLVVVTYTVLAAEELRTRTRQELLQRVSGPGTPLAHEGASAHGRQELLRDLRGAFFGTIHGFCLKLIREFGGRLGLPGKPELVEEHDLDVEWERFTQSGALDDLTVPADLLRHLTFSDLLRLARGLAAIDLDAIRKSPAAGAYPPAPDPAALDPGVISHAVSRAAAERDLEAFQVWLEDLKVPGAFVPLPVLTCGSKEFVPAFHACLAELRQWISRSSLQVATSMAARFREHRFARGRLSYADQIQCARRLLDDPEILRQMRTRGWRVILDEAQDTDRAMFEILTEITRPLDAPRGAWPDDGVGPEAGRFSFVGDEQQSIYGDRADPADYRRYVNAFKNRRSGELLTFDVTMRCAVTVVNAVNQVFADGIKRQENVEFRELKPRPQALTGAVWLLPLPEPPPEASDVAAKFLHEAGQVGRWLQQRGPAGFGAQRWSDLAVIAPRRKWLTAAAQLWTRDFQIPARELSSNQSQLESPAMSWPIALLHVLVEPWDRFEVLGVLREIFAVSDPELAAQHLCGGLSFWPEVPKFAAGVSRRLVNALQCLHDVRRLMAQDGFSAARLFDAALAATCLEERLGALGCASTTIHLLRAQAIAAECAGMSTRAWVRTLVASLSQPPAEVTDSVNAVTFLTCQKAKGLEWPVVLLLGFGRPLRKGGKAESFPRLTPDRGGHPVVQLHSEKDAAEKDEERAANAAEWQRFLYVTMTRARDYLIVPDSSAMYVSAKSKSARSDFAGLVKWDDAAPHRGFFAAPPPGGAVAPRASTKPEIESPLVETDFAAVATAALVSKLIPQAQSPSHLAHVVDETGPTNEDATPPLPDPLNADFIPLLGVGGKKYGTWWHDTLQQFPWRGDSKERRNFVDLAGRAIPGNEPWRDRAQTELRTFATSGSCGEIVAAGSLFQSEIPFAHAIAGDPPTWIEGILDLLVLRADGTAWIVDWKTDRLREGESAEELLARLCATYSPQLHAYADAIRSVGRKVTRCTLYSTALGSAVDC